MNRTNLNQEQKHAILEKMGWVVECISPFEIRHEDGSFASGQAANYLIDILVEEYDAGEIEEYEEELRIIESMDYIPKEIKRINDAILFHLNTDYTYSIQIEGLTTLKYDWGSQYALSDPLLFRVISWIKKSEVEILDIEEE